MISLGNVLQLTAENIKNHYKICNHCTILHYDLTHSCTPDYKLCGSELVLLSFLSEDTDQAKSQQVRWARWLFFEPHLIVLW